MKSKIKNLFLIAMCALMCTSCSSNKNKSSTHTHVYGSLNARVEPTCTEDGKEAYYECSECGQLFDSEKHEATLESLIIPKLGHDSGNIWYEEDGYHYHLCNRCHAKTDVDTHALLEHPTVEPGHEISGSMLHYECSVCGMKFLDSKGKVQVSHLEISPTGHDEHLTYHPEAPATCDVDGTKAYYSCSCGALFEDEDGTKKIDSPVIIPALGHLSNGVWKSNDNKHWHTCYRCGEILDEHEHIAGSEVHQDLEHTWKLCTQCGHKVDIHDRQITGCHHARLVHYDKVSPTFSKPGHIEYYYCFDCHKSFYDSACTSEIENTEYGVDDKRDGRYIQPITSNFSLLNSNLKDYLNAKTDKEIITALRNNGVKNDQAPKTIFWEDNRKTPYRVEVSKTRTFDSYKTYVTPVNSVTLEGAMLPGETYYYRVLDARNRYVLDDLSFKVDDSYSLRTMKIEGMYNVRDLGGWTAKDGHKVLYGKLFRGGALTGITEYGKDTLLETLGVKNEIDLRYPKALDPSLDGEQTLFDSRINYRPYPIWMYSAIIPGVSVGELSFVEYSLEGIRNTFSLLADENNYPIYYHCSAGADRTGTMSFLINGLLGVSYADLTKDFELTSFSVYGNRYRSSVTDNDEFDSSGIYVNELGNKVAWWGKLNDFMMYKYGDDKPLYKAIEIYLKQECNISDETISAVRRNLLGTDVDFSA